MNSLISSIKREGWKRIWCKLFHRWRNKNLMYLRIKQEWVDITNTYDYNAEFYVKCSCGEVTRRTMSIIGKSATLPEGCASVKEARAIVQDRVRRGV